MPSRSSVVNSSQSLKASKEGTNASPRVIVVGAGIGGLSASIFARRDFCEVTVYEKNNSCGGKASVRQEDGFVFDEGPSILVLKGLYQQFFSDLGHRLEDWIEFERLEPAFVVHGKAGDGSFTIHADFEETLKSVRDGLGEPACEELKSLISILDLFAAKLGNSYADRLFFKVSDFLSKELIASGIHVSPFSSYREFLFNQVKNPVLREFFLGFPGYAGLHPTKSAASLLLLPWSIFKEGVFYPKGGISAIPKALFKLATQMGVKFCFEHTLVSMESDAENGSGSFGKKGTVFSGLKSFSGNKKTSIGRLEFQTTDGIQHIVCERFDEVIFNGCLGYLAEKIFPGVASNPREHADFLTQSPSFMTLQCKAKLNELSKTDKNSAPGLAHHNLVLTGDVNLSYQDYFSTHDPLPIPAPLYINIPSVSDPTVAPSGYHNVFVVVSVPSLSPERLANIGHVDQEEQKFVDWCLKTMETTWPHLKIEVSKVRSRRDFLSDFLQRGGQIYGPNLEIVNGPLGKVRRSPVFSHLKNFYLVGGSTQPGAGVPMALQSGRLVGELAAKQQAVALKQR
jgi:phytoene desaturase